MTFRDTEKERYKRLKPILASPKANEAGSYRGKPREFCLADGRSSENLHAAFREDAIVYFRKRSITWHDGRPDSHGNGRGLPSNHLCCSQSACVNTLWPIAKDPELLAQVFRPFFPELAEALPIDADLPLADGSKPYLAFEWIGMDRYLGERAYTRGANTTSADFVFRFRRYDGRIHLVLGEWKYTESYGRKTTPPKQVQLDTYRHAFERWRAGRTNLPAYEDFFVEPFYQLMRLTLLAQEMERARVEGHGAMGADVVSVLVVVPKANRECRERFTVPAFKQYGRTVSSAWANLAHPDRFACLSTESLLTIIEQVAPESMSDWRDYLLTRYGWWRY